MRLLLIIACCSLLITSAMAVDEKPGWIPIGDRHPYPDPQGGCGDVLPAGELCDAAATPLGADPNVVIEWDTSNHINDYNDPSICTGYSAEGPDGAYSVTVGAGCTIAIVYDDCPPEIEWDRSLYFDDDCVNVSNCYCGSDVTFPGGPEGPEACSYTNNSGGAQSGYIVVDGFGGDFGPYQLTVTSDCPPVPTQQATWGTIKALYN